jgi:fluoride exporter
MAKILWIAAGGAVGSVLRYFVHGWTQSLAGGVFPWGILLVNVTGCLAIGILGAFFAGPHLVRDEYRAALLIGVLGAYTTFSTFGWDTFALTQQGERNLAIVNVLLSNLLGLTAVWAGFFLAEKCFRV